MLNDNKIFNSILKSGILIGSRAWGGFTEKSDWDLAIDDKKYQKILIYCKDNNISFRHFFGGEDYNITGHTMFNITNDKLTFDDGKVINIISYCKDDLPKILELNEIITFLNTTSVGKTMQEDKSYRIIIVESLLSVLFKFHKQTHRPLPPQSIKYWKEKIW